MSDYTVRSTCRVCGSSDLTSILDLGTQFVNDFVDPGKELEGVQILIQLDLCRDCTLVQARCTPPKDLLYKKQYWYRSGVTETMRNALRDVTRKAEKLVLLSSNDVVLDIGSNDGTLLRSYATKGIQRVGVEPADNLQEQGRIGVHTLIHDFWSASRYLDEVHQKAKVITACGMFYDLDDPNQFIRDVSQVLAPDGLFIAQLMCLRNMVDLLDVGNLSHEHLEFYSLKSLSYLLRKHGLEIIDIEQNSVNGSSYRLYIRHEGSLVWPFPGAYRRVAEANARESELADPMFYREFLGKIEQNRDCCVDFIRDAVSNGAKVWVYGASTKGNVILQYYGLDKDLIVAAAERSPEKWGKVTIGAGIPIKSEEEFRNANPTYALVLPYAFLPEFIAREAEWRLGGGKFLVPLPEFNVV